MVAALAGDLAVLNRRPELGLFLDLPVMVLPPLLPGLDAMYADCGRIDAALTLSDMFMGCLPCERRKSAARCCAMVVLFFGCAANTTGTFLKPG